MARTADYRSAFDVIGPIMVGPSSSHTAGAVRIGSAARTVLGTEPEKIHISYYESFAETHLGHGTDLAIIAGLLDFDPEDPRVKTSIEIAKEKGIDIEFVEETGTSIGDHPNTALVKLDAGDKHVEVLGNSIGGGTIKLRSIHINGACVVMNHTLPLIVLYGDSPIAEFNSCIARMFDLGVKVNEEIKSNYNDHHLIAIQLYKPIKLETYEALKKEYPNIEFANII
ncbi:L-serine ammonia-lyase, iron-sulfur-dependent, subunit beta [Macrococcus hajekii]|uniref:L-serine dehydratase n=1 Tax=Macrococcus hajekii TaxID=198482 RepID=A0A4R6BLU4_9STAP|nr:L-serine ammonia-lyase, iron-sulfur-dependent subunit beta [Macrococcus hajekii]TDM02678.1 L-serine ammonia-lyase, iron-sulfur-dependent, subunit beta [Macrococcus hajekii]GGB02994.1 L-serine dehydratase, iron-sulfur-dependent subunit beta [Macrococcus hajekii]